MSIAASAVGDMTNKDPSETRLREAADWLARLSGSTPSEAEIKAWAEWCSSQDNSDVFEELERIWRAARAHPASTQAITVLLGSGERRRLPSASRRWRNAWFWIVSRLDIAEALPRRWVLALAGMVAAGVVGSLAWFIGARVPQSASLASARAQDRAFTLADGSEVDLGGLSAVKVDLTRGQRLLTLVEGEAFFQDKHRLAWPFVVSVANVRMVARGTAFDVERCPDHIAVSVVNGIVDVSFLQNKPVSSSTAQSPDVRRSSASGHEIVELTAGEQLVILSSGAVVRNEIDPESAVAWRQGRLEFPDSPLGGVVEDVNRYARRPIRIADPRIGSLTFTGTVFLHSIDQWAASLSMVFPIVVDTSDPKFITLRLR